MKKATKTCLVGLASVVSSLIASAVQVVPDSNAMATLVSDKMVLTYKQSGTLRVTEGGKVRLLLVGGGGGGGARATAGTDSFEGAGGGAGGVVYQDEFVLEAGEYAINIGKGGEVNGSAQASAYGGNTTAFGLTAYGGGFGAKGCHFTNPGSGACGGGATANWNEMNAGQSISGGQAIRGTEGNLGYAGGAGKHVYDAAGGGGAGGVGGDGINGSGGIGYLCDITGTEVYYAGGGAANPGAGGLGGGGNPGNAGIDGSGGGGGSGAKCGSGVVILSFECTGTFMSDDFELTGGTRTFLLETNATVVSFKESGTLRVKGKGIVEMLMIGGGGGGGKSVDNGGQHYNGAGGGA